MVPAYQALPDSSREPSGDPVFTKRSFLKLPVPIDLPRLLAEYNSIPEDAWGVSHWDVHCSIDVLLLRGGAKGTPDDFVTTDIRNNPILASLPYFSSLLAPEGPFGGTTYAFIFRTKPNGITRIHWDDDEAWCRTFRIHIPIISNPGAFLLAETRAMHFGVGEAWTFDNQSMHSVVNGDSQRVHMIIDVLPNPKLRALLEQGHFDPGQSEPELWARTGGRARSGGMLPPLICMSGRPLTIKEKKDLGLNPSGFATHVVNVSKKNLLVRAPLRAGDILVSVNGVDSCDVSRSALDYIRLRHDPGQRVEVELLRNGRRLRASMLLKPENFLEWARPVAEGVDRARALLDRMRGVGSPGR
jgi:kumamolisin